MDAVATVNRCPSLNIEVTSLFFKALLFSLPSHYQHDETTVSYLVNFLK